MPTLTAQEIANYRLIKRMAVILMIIFRLDRPVGPQEISEILEIDRHTAGKYMKSAFSLGFLTRPKYHEGYTLSNKGKQLVLGQPLAGISPVASSSSTINLIDSSFKDSITTSSGENTPTKINDEIYDLLKTAGIGDPKRSELAQMEHITPEYLEAHLQSELDLPLIIWKMEREHEAPGHKDDCQCDTCGNKYVSGKYASEIEH